MIDGRIDPSLTQLFAENVDQVAVAAGRRRARRRMTAVIMGFSVTAMLIVVLG